MKRNAKMVLEYDGTRYKGWQKLGDQDATIQGKLEEILLKKTGQPVAVIGSGRTDAGVHALGQVANVHLYTQDSSEELQEYINHYLPQDVLVKELTYVEEAFHSRYHALEKIYSYRIHNHPLPTVFDRKYCLHVPEPLNVDLMERAAQLLQGTHDFLGFSSLKKTKKSTVHTLHSITLEKEGSKLHVVFRGDGFLLHSIRIMMGTLLEVGMGQRDPNSIPPIFTKKVRGDAGFTVPPHGLFLEQVLYKGLD